MPESALPRPRDRSIFLIAALFFIGLYSPTSVGGTYSLVLWALYFWLLAMILLALIWKKNGLGNVLSVANSIFIVAILFLGTITSPFPDYRWGGLLPYIGLALLFTLNLRSLTMGRRLRIWVRVANFINVGLGLAVILHSDLAGDFLVNLYSAGYADLVPYMMTVGKPVLTFATHSVGAFFYYLFFLINFETYKVYKDRWSLTFAICYVGLTFALLSFTGMALTALAILQIMRYSTKRRLKLTLALSGVVALLGLSALYIYVPYLEDWGAAWKFVSAIITSPSNGFLGRFTEVGTLYGTINYIRTRPFTPVGVGFRSDLMFGDSGPVEYYLRGSIWLVLSVYGGLFVFLRTNLISKWHVRSLFWVILAFETGFSSLGYFRTLYLLPVFVIYLNDLSRASGQKSGALIGPVPA